MKNKHPGQQRRRFEATEEIVPVENRLASQDAAMDRERKLITANHELCQNLNKLRAQASQDMHEVIGSKARVLAQAREKLRQRLANVRQTHVPTPQGLRQRAAARLQALSQARDTIKKSGVDVRKLRAVQASYKAKAWATTAAALQLDEKASPVIADPKLVPTPTHNPWTWRYPPYDEEWGGTWFAKSKGAKLISHSESRWSAQVGCHSRIFITDAGDSDYCWTRAMSEVWLWYKLPAAGMVEAWIDLQTIYANYNGYMEDEWGISDADLRQLSLVYLEVFSPPGKRRESVLLDYRRGEDEGAWSAEVSPVGSHRYAHLYSMEAWPGGQWVLMAIGVLDFNYLWVNDETCEAWLTDRYFISKVILRSTGAP